jgi:uncharacterized protein YodC (DUF2158 family)
MALIQVLFRKIGLLPPERKFKAGDLVQLLEGGPLMVVESIKTSKEFKTDIVYCKWFDPKTNKSYMHFFTDDQLKLT